MFLNQITIEAKNPFLENIYKLRKNIYIDQLDAAYFRVMQLLSKIYMTVLLLWAIGMLIWGLAGFFEYFTGTEPLVKLQNDAYPGGVQFVHWLLISITGGVFLFGYLAKWKWTPFAIVLLFSNLAVLCTIQTFDFMSEQWDFRAYFVEMISYVIHSAFLLFSTLSKSRFKHFE